MINSRAMWEGEGQADAGLINAYLELVGGGFF
jgi:hypothetical protein